MNKYGELAMTTVRDFDPGRWAAMDPQSRESFFSDLGEQIQAQVSDLTVQMQGQDVPGESYLEKVARINSTTKQAEEIVLTELVYSQLPADEDLPVSETTAAINEMNAARGATGME